MKFSLIPVGERFAWKGVVYTKTAPFIAEDIKTGAAKMVPRSSNVALLGDKQETEKADVVLTLEQAIVALEQLHQACSGCLDDLAVDLPGARVGEARERLVQAYRNSLAALKAQP